MRKKNHAYSLLWNNITQYDDTSPRKSFLLPGNVFLVKNKYLIKSAMYRISRKNKIHNSIQEKHIPKINGIVKDRYISSFLYSFLYYNKIIINIITEHEYTMFLSPPAKPVEIENKISTL